MQSSWSEKQVRDLSDKVIIVTGGNSGLGYESVQFFASKGAKVILASRSIDRGMKAKDNILYRYPRAEIEVMQLNLGSLTSIKAFTETFKSSYDRLDVLLNNAGIMTTPYGKTVDGMEQQIGVNHFGHYALTGQLLEVLKTTQDARIVTISSLAHKNGTMDFDQLMFEDGNGYTPMKAYGRSKLANLLFTYELKSKIERAGLDIKVLAAHPGGANTNLARHLEGKWWFKALRPLLGQVTQSAYQGALPGIRASLDKEAVSGDYYGPSGRREVKGKPVLVQSSQLSHNQEVAEKLWQVSEILTQISYEF